MDNVNKGHSRTPEQIPETLTAAAPYSDAMEGLEDPKALKYQASIDMIMGRKAKPLQSKRR